MPAQVCCGYDQACLSLSPSACKVLLSMPFLPQLRSLHAMTTCRKPLCQQSLPSASDFQALHVHAVFGQQVVVLSYAHNLFSTLKLSMTLSVPREKENALTWPLSLGSIAIRMQLSNCNCSILTESYQVTKYRSRSAMVIMLPATNMNCTCRQYTA